MLSRDDFEPQETAFNSVCHVGFPECLIVFFVDKLQFRRRKHRVHKLLRVSYLWLSNTKPKTCFGFAFNISTSHRGCFGANTLLPGGINETGMCKCLLALL